MTPAIERLIQLAEVARTRIQSLSPVADALVYELGEAIREVENDTVTDAAPDMDQALVELIAWSETEIPIEVWDIANAALAKARRRENGE